MSGSDTTFTSARFLTPDYLVQGQDNVLSCPLWRGGEIVEVDSGTVSIYDAGGAAVVSGAAVTVDGDGIATYTLLAALTSSRARGMGWRVEWSLAVGTPPITTPYRNAAGLVRSQLAPVITDADLFRRVTGLAPSGDAPLSSLTTFQAFIDEAWVTLHGRLTGKGSLPHLVMEPTALREPHLLLTLALIFEDFRTRLNEQFSATAAEYRAQYKAAWEELRFEYDTADTGSSDGRRKRSASPTVWLIGRG